MTNPPVLLDLNINPISDLQTWQDCEFWKRAYKFSLSTTWTLELGRQQDAQQIWTIYSKGSYEDSSPKAQYVGKKAQAKDANVSPLLNAMPSVGEVSAVVAATKTPVRASDQSSKRSA